MVSLNYKTLLFPVSYSEKLSHIGTLLASAAHHPASNDAILVNALERCKADRHPNAAAFQDGADLS